MSDNNLTTVAEGQTVAASHPNQYKTAMVGDMVPRATSGIPTDSAGDLGTDTYKFKDLHISGNAYADGLLSFIPSALVCPYAAEVAPNGWLLCNADTIGDVSSGATHEHADLETLFNLIKNDYGNAGTEIFANGDTVLLPDPRGYGLRWWDNGKGIDSGRAIGTTQTDSSKMPNSAYSIPAAPNHTHVQQINNAAKSSVVTQTTGFGSGSAGAVATTSDRADDSIVSTQSAGAHNHTISGGDAETRGKNFSFNAIIKI